MRRRSGARTDESPNGAGTGGALSPPYEVEVSAVELHNPARVIQFAMYKVVSSSRRLCMSWITQAERLSTARRCAADLR